MLQNQMLQNQTVQNQMVPNQMLKNQMLKNQMLKNQMLQNQMLKHWPCTQEMLKNQDQLPDAPAQKPVAQIADPAGGDARWWTVLL